MIAPDLFSFANLHRQYIACRRNKRNSLNALRFEQRQEENLLALCEALVKRTYVPSRSVCFFPPGPKMREVFAADFRDRVVHHVLVAHLEKIFEPLFIHDSYACRKGKGVHAAVRRLQQFMRQASVNGHQRGWYLQLDICNYFMSIDRDLLYAQVASKVACADALWLARVLIYHDCTNDYVYKGPPGVYQHVPPHKTLFCSAPNKGLPIGNLNSQFFANVYLNAFDQFVKRELKCRHYVRYCDDFVLLAESQAQLQQWQHAIESYLRCELALALNSKRTRIATLGSGIDFLGYIVRPDYLLVRRRVVRKLKAKLLEYRAQLVIVQGAYVSYRFDEDLLNKLHATLASYLGHCQMANTQQLWRSLWQRHSWLAHYFAYDGDSKKIAPTYKVPGAFLRAGQQYRYFRWRYSGAVILFQVGHFFEFYDHRDASTAQLLGLQKMRANKRRALYGFPAVDLYRHCSCLLKSSQPLLIVRQTEVKFTNIWHRLPERLVMPA